MADPWKNHLAGETSPYLLQHATNPVDWYPWGDQAFALARELDRPVFLSVGYAACHWCHVMERESFEDAETAAYLNGRFVSVKVDREERPDVDGIYMDAVQAMTGQGGWPMSVWLTPEGRPFYAGTYFPDEPRHGIPSFRQVLEALAEAWDTRRGDINAQGEQVVEAIGRGAALAASDEPITAGLAKGAIASLLRSLDPRWGGFGSAPKFPQPMVLEFLLRAAARGDVDAREAAVLTLDRMASGGMHDQVGGGFARYSTDREWHVPHFEKMLSDNAQLARVYTQGWLLTCEERHRRVAVATCEYLLREMQHPEGGFFASQDADSEGVEGIFFTWSWRELVDLVGEPVATAFGATPHGNWDGTNVLWHPVPVQDVARSLGVDAGELTERVADARTVLFAKRETRVHPGLDDKVITAWNGLAIRAFAEAGRAFQEPSYVEAAIRAGDFAWEHLRDSGGRLLRSWRDGRAGRPGFADDHALLAGALITLFEVTGDPTWFVRAREVSDALLELFVDAEHGGFFQTGSDAEELVVRPKEFMDNAVPSGNSAAAETLQRLARLTGEVAYERAAVGALRLVRGLLERAPLGFGTAWCAADLFLGPTREVAVIGAVGDPATEAMIDEVVRSTFRPNVVVAVGTPAGPASRAVALLEDRRQIDGRPTAYVCERFSCKTPVTDPAALRALLDGSDPVS